MGRLFQLRRDGIPMMHAPKIIVDGAQALYKACADAPRFWLWATAALALAHAALILASPVPPLHDYVGHLARIHIMTTIGDSEFLQRYYEYHWGLRHNMGTDVLIFLLAHVMPIELAGRIVVALIPALTFLGLALVRIQVHGRIDSLILLAAPYAFGTWFGWGFLNFCFSIALALIAFALWLRIRRWRLPARAGAVLAAGFVVWLFHLSGWATLCILVFAWEFTEALGARWRDVRALALAGLQAAWRSLPLGAPLLIMAVTMSGGGDLGIVFENPLTRLSTIQTSLAFTWDRVDRYCVFLLILAGAAALLFRLTKVSMGLAVAAGLLFFAFLFSPAGIAGGGSVGDRLATPLALVAATALTWRIDLHNVLRTALVAAISTGLALIALGRFAYTAVAFQDYNQQMARNVALIETMPEGARVIVLVVDFLRSGRPAMTYLPNIAVVRRDAFSNMQWEEIAGHPLVLKYWWEGPPVSGDEGRIIDYDEQGRPTGMLRRVILSEPLERFDYIWIVNSNLAEPPDLPQLELVDQTDRTALYRIVSAPQ
jgi:hypothetical protein